MNLLQSLLDPTVVVGCAEVSLADILQIVSYLAELLMKEGHMSLTCMKHPNTVGVGFMSLLKARSIEFSQRTALLRFDRSNLTRSVARD